MSSLPFLSWPNTAAYASASNANAKEPPPPEQIPTNQHPEFRMKLLVPDHEDPFGYKHSIFTFTSHDAIAAKLCIDQLAHMLIRHCLWAEPGTPREPWVRRRDIAGRAGSEKDDLDGDGSERDDTGPVLRVPKEWRGIVDIIIMPEVLTPSNATIVLMRSTVDESANLLWIFPKTMTNNPREADLECVKPKNLHGDEPVATNVTAGYIAGYLKAYTRPNEAGFVKQESKLFRHRWDFRAGTSVHSEIHTRILKLHVDGKLYIKKTEWTGAIPPPPPVSKAKARFRKPSLKACVKYFPGRLLERPASIEHECRNFIINVDESDESAIDDDIVHDGDWNSKGSDPSDPEPDPDSESDPDSEPDPKAANCESKAPVKAPQMEVGDKMGLHEQQHNNDRAEGAYKIDLHAQTDLWKQVGLHRQKEIRKRAGVQESELTSDADHSKHEDIHSWRQIREQANFHDLSESMLGSNGGSDPDHPDHPDSDPDPDSQPWESEALELELLAEVYKEVGTQKQQLYGQEGFQSWEQILKEKNSYDPPDSMKVAGARTASDHQEPPLAVQQVKADRITKAHTPRENRQFQNQYVLMELCKAAREQTDETKKARIWSLRYGKMARKNGMDVPQAAYCPIRQDLEYERAVKNAKERQRFPQWIVEAEGWFRRQATWAARIRQGDACEGLLYQERMNAEAETQARWEMRTGDPMSFMEKFKACEEALVAEEAPQEEPTSQEQSKRIRKRRKLAKGLTISALKSKRPSAEPESEADKAVQQPRKQQFKSEHMWSTTEESSSSSSMRSSLKHQETAKADDDMAAQQTVRHDSVSTAQSSIQSSVPDEDLSGLLGRPSLQSCASEKQQFASKEQSSTLEQSHERMKTFLENSPMFSKFLSPAGKINTDETVGQTEEQDCGPEQRPSPPQAKKRMYVDPVEDEIDRGSGQKSLTKRGRVHSDQDTEMTDV